MYYRGLRHFTRKFAAERQACGQDQSYFVSSSYQSVLPTGKSIIGLLYNVFARSTLRMSAACTRAQRFA